jgi:4-hydroxy-tetrahydrodipicolinate synthase
MENGIYPASVTPLDEKGRVDMLSTARLLAWFEAAGCKGAVLAGTNGEGPSLSAVEKRDFLRQAMPLKGKLELILGVATPSSDEAEWLCKQAYKDGASAILLMAPNYFREATESGMAKWFEEVLDHSPLPILIYNFPQRTGFAITAELLARLAKHDQCAGAKDSSSDVANLKAYKQAVGEKLLFVGNESLLIQAMESGWNGSISGAANAIPQWLCQILTEWLTNEKESALVKFELLKPVIEKLRKVPQPGVNKMLLHRRGILAGGLPRLPLEAPSAEEVEQTAELIKAVTGF